MKTSTHVAVFWCCLRVKYNNEICYEERVLTLESTLNCPSSADYHFELRVALKNCQHCPFLSSKFKSYSSMRVLPIFVAQVKKSHAQ